MIKMRIILRIERVARTKFVLVSLSFTLFIPVLTGAGLLFIDREWSPVAAVRLPAGQPSPDRLLFCPKPCAYYQCRTGNIRDRPDSTIGSARGQYSGDLKDSQV
jgi:hypothetical protein